MAVNQDSAGRHTGRFAGVQWDPPATWRNKSYLQGKTVEGINNPNYQKYTQWVPQVYGTAFVHPVAANWLGGGDSSRGEFIVCQGFIGGDDIVPPFGGVQQVIVNDILIPYNGTTIRAPDPLFRWNYVTTGSRDGRSNTDAGFTDSGGNPIGDPYGNLAVIEIVVPAKLASGDSVPSVQVVVRGPGIRVYTNPTTFTVQYSANPSWVILDLLLKSGWDTSILDIQSFIDAAAICDRFINYTDLNGNTNAHAQYAISLSIEQRKSAADIIRGIRQACKGVLVPNSASANGMLQFFIKQTLADQQPNPIDGSNAISAVHSKTASGDGSYGWPAYVFDESNILTKGEGDKKQSTLRISQRSIADSPNRVNGTFQDEENGHVIDTFSQVDATDVARSGQEVGAQLSIEGVPNYDQMRRAAETSFGETYRGNPRVDSGGTWIFDFTTSVRAQHLKMGHIVGISDQIRLP